MRPRFQPLDDAPGVVVVDPIQRRRCPVETGTPVDPVPFDADDFSVPVSSAVSLSTTGLRLAYNVAAYVRDPDGELVAEVAHDAVESLPPGEYVVELLAPVKLYLRVSAGLAVAAADESVRIEFDDEATVRLGARSYHDRPEATVTTTAEPTDAMAAVSTLGSALKATSCERSFPTLRGHPPRIELGDALDVPDAIDRPETGVRVEVPADLADVYRVAPLAYYLGAAVEPGDEPRLVTDGGFVHPLDGDRGFEAEVARVLKQLLLLDCATRTEGYYPVDLHERSVLDERLDLDFAALYGRSLAGQVEAYLSVPYAAVEDVVPTWRLVADVTAEPSNVEALPFVVDDLGIVRHATTASRATAPEWASTVEEFARGGGDDSSLAPGLRGPDDAATAAGPEAGSDEPYVEPAAADALEQVWVGEGRPIRAGKFLRAGFEHRLERTTTEDAIGITVVCNDPAMAHEYDGGLYGNRGELPFEVAVHREATVETLRDALSARTDFLHYVGHVEDGGFVCADGTLRPTDLDGVGAYAFLLNGCRSYQQGLALVEAGSVGGVVTHSDVGNEGAVEVGRLVARLLNRGFSLASALEIAREQRIVGNQYVVVGDGGADVVQSDSGTPNVCGITEQPDGRYALRVRTYPSTAFGMGTMVSPLVEGVDRQYLSSGPLPAFSDLNERAVREFLDSEPGPVRYENELVWPPDLVL